MAEPKALLVTPRFVRRVESLFGGDPVDLAGRGPEQQGKSAPETIYAKLTAVDGSGRYTWTEQLPTAAAGWEGGPRSGTPTSMPARSLLGRHPIGTGSPVVILRRAPFTDAGDAKLEWRIATRQPVQWAKVAEDKTFTDGLDTVNCHPHFNGVTDTGTTFPVYVMSHPEPGPRANIAPDQIIAYEYNAEGYAVCVSDVLDDPIGTIKIWSAYPVGTYPIPRGWHYCDGTNGTPNLAGKFVMGYDAAETTPIGGHKTIHILDHGLNAGSESVTLGGPDSIRFYHPDDGTDGMHYLQHDDAFSGGTQNIDVRPPYSMLPYIMRVE